MSVTLHSDGYYVGNDYMTQAQMEVNAAWVKAFLSERGWTLNAICGLLGNLQAESNINPGLWESRTYWPDTSTTRRGFGLTQWTPWTKYTEWATGKGYDWEDMYWQCWRIHDELSNPGSWDQYYKTNEWPITGPQFIKSTDSAYDLACVFARNYERSAAVLEGGEAKEKVYRARGGNANKWWAFFEGGNVPDPPIIPPDPDDPDPPDPINPTTGRRDFIRFYLKTRRRNIVVR